MSSHSLIVFTTAFLLVTAAQSSAGSSIAPRSPEVIRVVDGRLLLGDQLVLDHFSLVQSKFSFLFIYLPARGLVTISNRQFPGAEEAGQFAQDRLELDLDGLALRLESTVPILRSSETSAWAALDSTYRLKVESVLIGYGDNLDAPKTWERYVHSSR